MHGVHVARVQFPAPRPKNTKKSTYCPGGPYSFTDSFTSAGLVAHLVERCIRIAEVRGSSPLKSTTGCGIKAIIHASGACDPGSIPGSPTK